ncbi:hypothetical protein F5J12DRAFT_929098 [Pisolithus orientalis]|uniref:uncharacterized protein n=1 Tax=Pisolithus orientalis TaxID=936130 RepID=UPI00222445BB|nr:uncharacterized protein F5J12DRAFT_929098 [Pisolithus orientalis]KAI5996873.1 hypothetical protein F5J12DRAFT_929098 [Pisolithus orientalis]
MIRVTTRRRSHYGGQRGELPDIGRDGEHLLRCYIRVSHSMLPALNLQMYLDPRNTSDQLGCSDLGQVLPFLDPFVMAQSKISFTIATISTMTCGGRVKKSGTYVWGQMCAHKNIYISGLVPISMVPLADQSAINQSIMVITGVLLHTGHAWYTFQPADDVVQLEVYLPINCQQPGALKSASFFVLGHHLTHWPTRPIPNTTEVQPYCSRRANIQTIWNKPSSITSKSDGSKRCFGDWVYLVGRAGDDGGAGSALIGGLVSAALYGVTNLQTYLYLMHYSADDASIMKCLVTVTWILDTVHVMLMCHILYYYLVTNYGIPTSLDYIVWSYPASFLVNILVVSVVQCFFAHKIYRLCRPQLKWLLTTPVILLVLVRFGSGMGFSALVFVHNEATILTQTRVALLMEKLVHPLTSRYSQFSVVIPTGTPLLLSEGMITVSLCVLLYGGSRDGLPRMKRLLHTLIIYAVNRCLLTLLVAIAVVIMAAEVQVSWEMGLDFIIGRSSLNTRKYLQSKCSETTIDLHINTINFADPPKLSGQGESSKDGERQFRMCEIFLTDVTADPTFDQTTTLQGESEV